MYIVFQYIFFNLLNDGSKRLLKIIIESYEC